MLVFFSCYEGHRSIITRFNESNTSSSLSLTHTQQRDHLPFSFHYSHFISRNKKKRSLERWRRQLCETQQTSWWEAENKLQWLKRQRAADTAGLFLLKRSHWDDNRSSAHSDLFAIITWLKLVIRSQYWRGGRIVSGGGQSSHFYFNFFNLSITNQRG